MNQWETALMRITGYGRNLFISIMVIYMFVCLSALGISIVSLVGHGTLFDFVSLKSILNDALYTLIILAIVKTLFINNSFDYAVTFLEIGFVVILRKLILIDIAPDELGLVIALGLISALFFVLILVTSKFRKNRELPLSETD
jgi:hypothetical protein